MYNYNQEYFDCHPYFGQGHYVKKSPIKCDTTAITTSTTASEITIQPLEPKIEVLSNLNSNVKEVKTSSTTSLDDKKYVKIPAPDIFQPNREETDIGSFKLRLIDREWPVLGAVNSLIHSVGNTIMSFPLLSDYYPLYKLNTIDNVEEIHCKWWIPLNSWAVGVADVNGKVREVRKLSDMYVKPQQNTCIYRKFRVVMPNENREQVTSGKEMTVNMSLFYNVWPYFRSSPQCLFDQVVKIADGISTLNVNIHDIKVFEDTCRMVVDYWESRRQANQLDFHMSASQAMDELICTVIGITNTLSQKFLK
jgi:hypothetical protein